MGTQDIILNIIEQYQKVAIWIILILVVTIMIIGVITAIQTAILWVQDKKQVYQKKKLRSRKLDEEAKKDIAASHKMVYEHLLKQEEFFQEFNKQKEEFFKEQEELFQKQQELFFRKFDTKINSEYENSNNHQ